MQKISKNILYSATDITHFAECQHLTWLDRLNLDDPMEKAEADDQTKLIQNKGVTHEKKYLDLAKHYLDIRGLDNSVGRSRHNQSYKPVLEQSEAVGHAVNAAFAS